MLEQILWGLACLVPTVLLHCLYSLIILRRLRRAGFGRPEGTQGHHNVVFLIVEVVCVLFILHFTEAAMWAALYTLHPHGFQDFATSLYFSIASYTTIGYGDLTLGPDLRLTGAIEGIVGTFMFGWSVAILVSVLKPEHCEGR